MNPATNVRSIVPHIGSMLFGASGHNCSNLAISNFPALNVPFSMRVRYQRTGAATALIFGALGASNHTAAFYYRSSSLRVERGSAEVLVNGNFDPVIGRWYDLVYTFDGVNHRLYVDGVLTASSTATPRTVVPDKYRISTYDGTNEFINGRVASARYYNLTLTAQEVLTLHLHNITPYDGNPVICVLNLETTANQIKGNQWLDKSGNNNHATIVGPTFSYEAPTKRIAQIGAQRQLDGRYDGVVSGGVTIAGGAMVFDGVSGWVNPPVISQISKSKPFSISVWFMKTSGIRLLSHALADADRFGISFVGDEIRVGIYNGVSYFVSKSGNTLSGQMNCLVVTFDGASNLRAYVNNVEITNVNGPSASGALFEIGKQSSSYFAGQIPQLTVFNRSLTADERTAIFNAGKDAPSPVKRGLIAEYSGRDWEGPAATPTKVFDVASWDGMNILT